MTCSGELGTAEDNFKKRRICHEKTHETYAVIAACTYVSGGKLYGGRRDCKSGAQSNQNYFKFQHRTNVCRWGITLKVKSVKPSKASKKVTWKSSNRKIATVTSSGKVKARKEGTVTITATSKNNPRVKAKCRIKVYKATKTIKLNSKKSYTLKVGQKQKLSAKVTSPKKGAQPIEWSSRNKKIASVNKSSGLVKAVSKGKTTITGKSGKKKVTVTIVVQPKANPAPSNPTPPGPTPDPTPDPIPDPAPEDVLYSGKYRGMRWSIDKKGKLLIKGKMGQSEPDDEYWGGYNHGEIIRSAVMAAENVTELSFYGCDYLTSLDVSGIRNSKITKIYISGCNSLTSLDLRGLDTGI